MLIVQAPQHKELATDIIFNQQLIPSRPPIWSYPFTVSKSDKIELSVNLWTRTHWDWKKAQIFNCVSAFVCKLSVVYIFDNSLSWKIYQFDFTMSVPKWFTSRCNLKLLHRIGLINWAWWGWGWTWHCFRQNKMPSARLMNFLKVMCETFDYDRLSYIGHCIGSGGEREECCDQKSQQNVIKSRPESNC